MCLAPGAEPRALWETCRHPTELLKAPCLSFITLSEPELQGAYQIQSDCAAQGHILLCTHSTVGLQPQTVEKALPSQIFHRTQGKEFFPNFHLPRRFCHEAGQCYSTSHHFRPQAKNQWSQRLPGSHLVSQEKSWQSVAGFWFMFFCSQWEHEKQVRKEASSP